jgi:1-deoxy-D-xylulose-5-phosphate reductoisomerase
MAIPISYILAYPDRLPLTHLPPLDLAAAGQLTFLQPDLAKFPCLGLAYEALARGGTCPAVLNAANEVTVASFLSGQIRFSEIAAVNRQVLDAYVTQPATTLDGVLEADRWARRQTQAALGLAHSPLAVSA